jgi:hypothetical protein
MSISCAGPPGQVEEIAEPDVAVAGVAAVGAARQALEPGRFVAGEEQAFARARNGR